RLLASCLARRRSARSITLGTARRVYCVLMVQALEPEFAGTATRLAEGLAEMSLPVWDWFQFDHELE
ncbi:MAG: hypothetical protein ACREIA_14905, partial [Opitutaceae bacterium]